MTKTILNARDSAARTERRKTAAPDLHAPDRGRVTSGAASHRGFEPSDPPGDRQGNTILFKELAPWLPRRRLRRRRPHRRRRPRRRSSFLHEAQRGTSASWLPSVLFPPIQAQAKGRAPSRSAPRMRSAQYHAANTASAGSSSLTGTGAHSYATTRGDSAAGAPNAMMIPTGSDSVSTARDRAIWSSEG